MVNTQGNTDKKMELTERELADIARGSCPKVRSECWARCVDAMDCSYANQLGNRLGVAVGNRYKEGGK